MPELLGEFPSENELPEDAVPVAAPKSPQPRFEPPAEPRFEPPPRLELQPQLQPRDSVSIAELLARSVTLEWFEAIAISQGLCKQLGESADRAGALRLQPENVFIDATGSVKVEPASSAAGPSVLEQVADLLRAMLPDHNIPAPLRLAILQSSSTGSLAQWSNTIGYYERPNRTALIKAVYERAVRTTARPAIIPAATSQWSPSGPVVPLPPTPASVPVVQDIRRLSLPRPTAAHIVAACGVIAVGTLIGAGAWMIQRPASQGPAAPIGVVQSAPEPETSGSASISDRRVADAAQATSEPSARVPKGQWIELEPLKEPPRPRTKPSASASSQSQPPATGQSLSVVVPLSPTMTARETSALLDPSVEANPASPSPAVSRRSPVRSVIYSQADADVVPPTAVYPRFPSTLPPGINPADVAEFDVVVNETGGVESVRVRRLPATMSEAMRVTMGLSAAKAWRFSPGTLNGEPVKYRQVVWVLTN